MMLVAAKLKREASLGMPLRPSHHCAPTGLASGSWMQTVNDGIRRICREFYWTPTNVTLSDISKQQS